jgi:hypothetical protein
MNGHYVLIAALDLQGPPFRVKLDPPRKIFEQ